MPILNTVPPTDDASLIKTLAFPFQRGATGFPAMAATTSYTFVNIVALLMTGLRERVMRADLGVDISNYVFSSMTPIQRARISNQIANAIETFIPGTIVNSIVPSQLKYQDGIGSSIVFDISYTVGGQGRNQQIIYPPTLQGQ